MVKLSVTLATYNEQDNIGDCLESISEAASEIVIVDGSSTDKTVSIAKSFGAKVIIEPNQPNFHINKQKANDKALSEWILQLDADEGVTEKLLKEIKEVLNMTEEQLRQYQRKLSGRKLFLKHQKLLEERDGPIGNTEGAYIAFFIPRLNYFLGKYLRYGGVYPDGVIRLFKKDKAYLPAKSVHEQYVVNGRVGWLQNPLLHKDSPTLSRYLERNNRYIDLIVKDLAKENTPKNLRFLIVYLIIKPIWWFLKTQIIHKGILDGWQGVVFSFFSSLRFPRAYIRYIKQNENK